MRKDIYDELLQAQKDPFEKLWSAQTHVAGNQQLVNLKEHALRLLRILENLADNGSKEVWEPVYVNLHLAVSLVSIGLYTDVHGDSLMCDSAAQHDAAQSSVTERFVAGQLAFQNGWNAFELAGSALFAPNRNISTQSVRHVLEKFSHRPLYGLQAAVFDAQREAMQYIDVRHSAYREAIESRSLLGISAEILRQFRNGLLHGKIQTMCADGWPAQTDEEVLNKQTELFHTQMRLVLFLLQSIIAKVEPKFVMIWPNDGDHVEDLIFGLQSKKHEARQFQRNCNSDGPQLTLFPEQRYLNPF
jgi:hypothetical protein|tara:strand:+ start:8073 stop:8978 length:906 start_codon:yes stop_codon:yes gene_type:complete